MLLFKVKCFTYLTNITCILQRDVLNAQLKMGHGGEGDGGEAVSNETGVGFVHSTWWKFSLSGNSVSILFYFKSDMKYFNQILKL